MRTLQWMAAAQHRRLTLTKPGAHYTVTVTPAGRGWRVTGDNRATVMDAVRLEDHFETLAFRGWREAAA